MSAFAHIQQKIQTAETLRDTAARWRAAGERVVFTNGNLPFPKGYSTTNIERKIWCNR